jgi:SAM-dependent methyltransferase
MSSSPSSGILESPSAERNKGPIFDQTLESIVLPSILDSSTTKLHVLELAAGCGVHTTHFVSSIQTKHPHLKIEWHPSDPDLEARVSIDARVKQANLEEYVVPANGWMLGKAGGTACNDGHRDRGDAGSNKNGGDALADTSCYNQYHQYFDLITCINMIHIAPWEASLGLMECAGKTLRKGGMLVCYGPYKVGGTAIESNLKFDASLKSKDSSWGVRDLEEVVDIAKKEGLEFVQRVEMPANNLSVLFRKN